MTEEEKEIEKLNQGRLLRDAGQVLLPLLAQMKLATLAKITGAHRTGMTQALPTFAAELTVITDLEAKIKQNEIVTEQREKKLYGNRSD